MTQEKLFHVGVKALITNSEGKVLIFGVNTKHLIADTTPHGDLPGGRIQIGQGVEDALRREVEEETGITEVSDIEFFSAVVSNIEIPISDTEKVGLVLMIYKVKVPEDSTIILSEEHNGYEWLFPALAAKRLTHKYPKAFTDKLAKL